MARARQPLDPTIRRVPLGTLQVYEITEDELEALERATPESLYLNLAIFTGSVFLSFVVSLSTTTISGTATLVFFWVVTVCTFLSAVTFSLLWKQATRSANSVARRIRGRVPPEGVQDDPGAASSATPMP